MEDVCWKYDNFLNEKAIWIAKITDGNFDYTIYQDDDRPNVEPKSAWIRLGILLQAYPEYYITDIHLKFRDHIVTIPKGIGYYFSKGALGELNCDSTYNFLIFGVVTEMQQESIVCNWYHVPSLEVIQTSVKTRDEWVPPFIIWNLTNP